MRGNGGKIAGLVVTLVCLYLAFRQVDLQELVGALAGAKYWLIGPAASNAGRSRRKTLLICRKLPRSTDRFRSTSMISSRWGSGGAPGCRAADRRPGEATDEALHLDFAGP